MKNLKYVFIFIALICTPNAGAMHTVAVDCQADEKTARSPFDIDVINERLAKIQIDGGVFKLEEVIPSSLSPHYLLQPYDAHGKAIELVVPQRKKCCSRFEQSYVIYERGTTDDKKPINSIELLGVVDHYQGRGLGTILTLVALHRGLSYATAACVDARAQEVQKIFKTLGFNGTLNNLWADNVQELLETTGKKMLDKAFVKLEHSKLPCYQRAWLCCAKRVSSWFACCNSKKKVKN